MSQKPSLLFLCHRIPYPPNKGDKIRSYHLLLHLSERYRVFLGTFIDDPNDWQYVSKVEKLCEQVLFLRLNPLKAKIWSLKGLVTKQALSLPYYESRRMSRWVKNVVSDHGIDRVMVYSSAMAQFARKSELDLKTRVIDFVDIDSDKWRQYAEKRSWPMNWVYRRESDLLLEFEEELTNEYDTSLFVSSTEAAHFKQLVPQLADKVSYYNNGVDSDYFSPEPSLDNPYPGEANVWVFTGAMDYWANVDAVSWFAEQVWPKIAELAEVNRLYIVGSNPTEQVMSLSNQQNIIVTGRVEDIRPYVQYAKIVVAPMRIARGIQNKVLEGMAMEKPVLVSSLGLEGISAQDKAEVLIADDPEEYLNYSQDLIQGLYSEIGENARSRVMTDFNWAESLPIVSACLEQETN